ncbi:hyalin-like [Amphiura filiformis]|uniref:hyalin-like n=1 Tax=Amphiura filiformis TaxID=82378 RepID=UPI003B217C36
MRYCGTSLDQETMQSRSNYLWLQFRSDVAVVRSGFRVEYEIRSSDTTPPVIAGCPNTRPNSAFRITSPVGSNFATAFWTEPRGTDHSGVTPTRSRSHAPGSSFPVGVTRVTYRFFDASGNVATCGFDVIVSPSGVDNIPPVITGCPNNVRVSAPVGSTSAIATWTEPRATDNSGDTPTRTRTHTPGSSFPTGTTTVTYRFFDASANIATCEFDVIVTSSGGGGNIVVSNCPNDLNMIAPQGSSFYQADWEEPSAIDTNGGVVSVMASHTPPRFFTVPSENEITYTISNDAGDEAVCMFTVSVSTGNGADVTPPVVHNCPESFEVQTQPGETAATASWIEPIATDDSEPVTSTRSHSPGQIFPPGMTVVTYEFFDAVRNRNTCTFIITVTTSVDNIPPVITGCPNTVRVTALAGSTSAIATWTEPRATDNSGNTPTRTRTRIPWSSFPIGRTVVTYRFFDASVNIATCQFDVIVTSSGGGGNVIVRNCPNNLNMIAPQRLSFYQVDWEEPSAIDTNGGVVSVMASHTPPRFFTVPSENEITYTFSNNAGNEAVCMFTVSVSTGNGADVTPPVVHNCPERFEVQTQPGETAATASWIEPIATDDSEPVTSTRSHSPGQIFPPGMTVVTYEFFDAVQNRNTCTFIITVTTPLGIQCPQNIAVNAPVGQSGSQVNYSPATASGGATPYNIEYNPPGNFFVTGQTTVTGTVFDRNSNQQSCTFTVTVNPSTAPLGIQCPQNIAVNAPVGQSGSQVNYSPATASGGATPYNIEYNPPGNFFVTGQTTVTATVFDGNSNQQSCTFTVTVNPSTASVDNIPPVITGCPNTVRVTALAGSTSAIATWTEPRATDNSGNTPTRTRTRIPWSSFPIGRTVVTYRFFDASVNIATCQFDVIVTSSGGGGNVIVRNCPNNLNMIAPQGLSFYQADWEEPSAIDTNGGVVSVMASNTPPRFFTVPSENEITYTFSNNAGNEAVCMFTVSVSITGAPRTVSGCPTSTVIQNVAAGTTGPVEVTFAEPTATGSNIQIFSTHRSGGNFPIGVTTVAFYFIDDAGNQVECQFTVTVQVVTGPDTTAPTVNNCPSDIAQTVSNVGSTATVTWQPPTATDNVTPVGQLTQTQTRTPGSQFGVGTTAVQYAFTDAAGNTGFCTFNVIITVSTDTVPPVVANCASDITRQLAPGSTSIAISWTPPTVTDNITPANRINVVIYNTNQVFTVGTVPVTYIFTDAAGNEARCSFNIIVTCESYPAFKSYVNVVIYNTNQVFTVGTVPVTYIFTDAAGNEARCSFNIIVTSPGAPTVTNCPSDINDNLGAGPSQRVTWTEPTGRDNRGTTIVPSQTHRPGSNFPIGVTTVTYTFMAGGQEARCTFTVTIRVFINPCSSNPCPAPRMCYYSASSTFICIPSQAPPGAPTVTNCPSDINLGAGPSQRVTWTEPTGRDNRGTTIVPSQTHRPGSNFPIGVTTVTYTFMAGGQEARCTFTVTIRAPGAPTVTNCPSDINENLGAGPSQRVTWTEPTGRDNRGTTIVPSQTHRPGSNFPIGVTTVTYTFMAGGQEARCTFTVTIRVFINPCSSNPCPAPRMCYYSASSTFICLPSQAAPGAPTVTNCPSDINENLGAGPSQRVTWTEPTGRDNRGTTIVPSQTHRPGSNFPIGVTTVTYTFMAGGQEARCTFTVTIRVQPPNPCSSNPCPAPRTCYYIESAFICLPGLAGGRKRRDIEDVESMPEGLSLSAEENPLIDDDCPCENGGTCMKDPWNGGGNYCVCPAGYSGILCEKDGDETTVKVEYGVELVGATDKLHKNSDIEI